MRVDTHSARQRESARVGHRGSVYDGQDRLGDFQQHDDVFVARNRCGKTIGVFPTAIEAINAVAIAAGDAS